MRRYPKSVRQRILRNCRIRGDCWVWAGTTRGDYGIITIAGSTRNAHRASYAAFTASVPRGVSVLHRCKEPLCCNPAHLYLDVQEKPLNIAGAGNASEAPRMADAI